MASNLVYQVPNLHHTEESGPDLWKKKIYGPSTASTLGGPRSQPRAFRSKLRSASSAWCWARPSKISSSRASRMPRPPRAFQPGISSPVTTLGLGETTGCSYSTQGLLMQCLFPLITNYLVSMVSSKLCPFSNQVFPNSCAPCTPATISSTLSSVLVKGCNAVYAKT